MIGSTSPAGANRANRRYRVRQVAFVALLPLLAATSLIPSVSGTAWAQTGGTAGATRVEDPLLRQAEEEARRLDQGAGGATGSGGDCKPANAREIYYGEPINQKATVGISFMEDGSPQICTGVVVAENAVLTAGHCSCGSNYRLWFGERISEEAVSIRPSRVSAYSSRFGRYDCRATQRPQPGFDYGVITFDPSALGLPEQRKGLYTIAKVLPPALARVSRLEVGGNLLAVGYGLTETNSKGRKLGVPIPVSSWDCAEPWAGNRGCQSFSEIIMSARPAAGKQGLGRDSCGGDSGGPAFAVVATETCNRVQKSYYLVAITSRGMQLRSDESTEGKPCGGGGVYEVVARQSVIDWLRANGVAVDVEKLVPGR